MPKLDRGMESALWNLALYRLPTMPQLMQTAKGDDPIPYRFCPHVNKDNLNLSSVRMIAFCGTHIAYMCGECWSCHSYECTHRRRN